jgi:signal transduction histidine kinase
MNHRVAYRFDRLDYAAATLVAVLTVATVVFFGLRSGEGHVAAPGLDLVLDTLACVIMAAVALLSGVRYGERKEPIALTQASGFAVLSMAYGIAVAVSVARYPARAEDLVAAGEAQMWVFGVARILATGLIMLGGLATLRHRRTPWPAVVLVMPALVLGWVAVNAFMGSVQVPPLATATLNGPATNLEFDSTLTPLGVLVMVVGVVLTFAAAEVCRRIWRSSHNPSDAYLALALVLASFAQIHEVLDPGIHPIQVATGDLLWLAVGVVLLLIIEAGIRRAIVDLRAANDVLERLRRAEADRVTLEERARLSRELHDGLAQDLWLAKLKASRLAAVPGLPREAAEMTHELAAAIDAGLDEARHAVLALRSEEGSPPGFAGLLARSLDEFEDRFGLRTELACPPDIPTLPARTEAELHRITQEALNNIAHHADATFVRVSVEHGDGTLRLSIRDNGKGFDVTEVPRGRYGLAGMRERASLIGAELAIESAPLEGTAIIVEMPLAPSLQPSLQMVSTA